MPFSRQNPTARIMLRPAFTFILAIVVGALGGWVFWRLAERMLGVVPAPLAHEAQLPGTNSAHVADDGGTPSLRLSAAELAQVATWMEQLNDAHARTHEAVLTFSSADGLQRFVARASPGLAVVARLDPLRALRVRFAERSDIERELAAHPGEFEDAAANLVMQLPDPPTKVDRDMTGTIPVGSRLWETLGVETDPRQWGRGVTIAIVDTGVTPDPTFGTGRLRTLDLGLGISGKTEGDGHATAVASLAAGASRDAPGVAPAATILSIRVTDESGLSDTFTVAQAIVAAVDQGAQIVNISLGAHQSGWVLNSAINYAANRGVLLVAAAGNDQAAQLEWPAADPRVVSVGAVDAVGNQLIFSNAGPQLQLTAPGLGLLTAWTEGSRVWFDGTSASAPIVAGAIAALMTQNPGLTAIQARDILRQYSSDGGREGVDPDYGAGIVNLGWAMARNDPARVDTAVSSHYYDPVSDSMQFVIQNRSARGVGGSTLAIDVDGSQSEVSIPWIDAGATRTISVPAHAVELPADQQRHFHTELRNAPGTIDVVPTNNVRTSSLSGLHRG